MLAVAPTVTRSQHLHDRHQRRAPRARRQAVLRALLHHVLAERPDARGHGQVHAGPGPHRRLRDGARTTPPARTWSRASSATSKARSSTRSTPSSASRTTRPRSASSAPPNPKAVFVFYPGDMGIQFLKQYAQAGLRDADPALLRLHRRRDRRCPPSKEAALGNFETRYWSPDLKNEANRKYVGDFRKKFGYTPSFYGAQSYDGMLLIDSAVRAVKGDLGNKKGMIAAMRKADYKSTRGALQVQPQPLPDPELLPAQGGEGRDGEFEMQIQKTVFENHKDSYSQDVHDEVVARPRAGPERQGARRRPRPFRLTGAGAPRALGDDSPARARAVPERAAARRHALPHGRRAHARVRDHEPRQPGPRLALHGGRLPRDGAVLTWTRLVRCWRSLLALLGHALVVGHAGRGRRAPDALRARPPRPGAGHLRPDPLLQRAGEHRVGARRALHERAAGAGRPRRDHARRPRIPSIARSSSLVGLVRRGAAVRCW